MLHMIHVTQFCNAVVLGKPNKVARNKKPGFSRTGQVDFRTKSKPWFFKNFLGDTVMGRLMLDSQKNRHF